MTTRREQLEAMMKEDPNDVFLHYALGLELYKVGEYAIGMDKMQEIIALHTDYVPAYFQLAQWLVEADETGKAIAYLRQALDLTQQQKDEKAHREIAEFLFVLELALEDNE